MTPQPWTLVTIDPSADCAMIERVARMIERATPCRDGLCPYGVVESVPAVRIVVE